MSGTDGPAKVSPFRGINKVFKKICVVLARFDDVEARSRAYAATLAVIASATAVALLGAGYGLGDAWVVALLAAVAALAERGRVRLNNELEESISLVPTLFAAVLFGPLASMLVAAASLLLDFRRPYLKWVSFTSSRALTAVVTGIAASLAYGRIDNGLAAVALATLAGALVSQLLDAWFAAFALRLRRRATMRATVVALAPLALASVPLYAPVVAFLAYAYTELSPLTLPLFFAPALAAQRLFALYQDQRRLTEDLVSANTTLERANLSFATALVATLDARDRYTAGHSAAVAVYARDIAHRMSLSEEEQQLAHLCGLVHDVGKIGLPAGLLEKPGALTLDERREMQKHSEIGERILANVNTYAEIAAVVRHHHERVDGEGYPDGIREEEIPLLSRIVAVADAYNAMTSDRPYRDAMPSRVARLRLAQAVETQFDTSVVAAFEAILASRPEDYRLARGLEFGVATPIAAPISTPALAAVGSRSS
jgi:putative nucleotidyltransferase with HDIG domain